MAAYLVVAVVAASLGFVACGLLSGSKLRDVCAAYLLLAEAVHKFTESNRGPLVNVRITDLMIPATSLKRLKQALEQSQDLFHQSEDNSCD